MNSPLMTLDHPVRQRTVVAWINREKGDQQHQGKEIRVDQEKGIQDQEKGSQDQEKEIQIQGSLTNGMGLYNQGFHL